MTRLSPEREQEIREQVLKNHFGWPHELLAELDALRLEVERAGRKAPEIVYPFSEPELQRENQELRSAVLKMAESLSETHDELVDHLNHGSKCFHCGCAVKEAFKVLNSLAPLLERLKK